MGVGPRHQQSRLNWEANRMHVHTSDLIAFKSLSRRNCAACCMSGRTCLCSAALEPTLIDNNHPGKNDDRLSYGSRFLSRQLRERSVSRTPSGGKCRSSNAH
jgi:hypothetical protein